MVELSKIALKCDRLSTIISTQPNKRKDPRMKNYMKNSRLVFALFALTLALPFTVATGHAQQPQQPSAKVTAKVSNRTLIGPVKAANGTSADSGWVTILCNNIKTANQKDLFITAALEVGIETETAAPPETEAKGKLEVRVLRDGQEVEPGVVVYGKREQELEVSGDATVELELETLDAASFSFVDVDVPVGVHEICVQARVRVKTEGGDAEATGAVGKGTLTVESVRMIKGEDVIVD